MDFDKLIDEDIASLAQIGVTLPINAAVLRDYLPHRYPFMLLDRVTAVKPNEWITGLKNITINEPFFNGHFPEEPIMPGVLMIEAMAQVAGVLGHLGLTGLAFLLQFLKAGNDHGQQLHDNRRRNVRHDADSENR